MTERVYRVPPDEKRCTKVRDDGTRCRAWRSTGRELCSGHAGLGAAGDREAARKGALVKAQRHAEARQEARIRAVSTPRELMAAAIAQRVEDGRVVSALDRALASGSDAVALRAVELVLDRVYPKVTLTESQLPGTQAYVELRDTLMTLDPAERLAYLREQRLAAAAIEAAPPPPPHALAPT